MFKNLTLGLVLTCCLFSCKKEEINTSPYNEDEGKQVLEDNAIELVTAIDNFRNDPALLEVENFLETLESYLTEEYEEEEDINVELDQAFLMSQVKTNLAYIDKIKNINNDILSAEYPIGAFETAEEEPLNDLQEEYNESVGIYTWNEETNEFDITENPAGTIIVNMTLEGETTSFTISNFSSVEHTEIDEAFPTSVNTILKIGANTLMEMEHTMELSENQLIPTSIAQSVSFGSLSYEMNMETSDEQITSSESLEIDGVNILSYSATLNGTFEEATTVSNSDEEVGISILDTASSTFSIGKTTISFEGELPSETEIDNAENNQALESLLNNSVDVTISSGGREIADAEFEIIEETNTDEFGTYTDVYPNLILNFDDGTSADIEAYTEVGFDDLMDRINQLVETYGFSSEE